MLRRARCLCSGIIALALLGTLLTLAAPAARGQVIVPAPSVGPAQQIPSPIYFNALPAFYNGNYRDTLALFLSESRSGLKNANSQWIDAIVYFTMAGECYHQLGQPKLALEQYDAALKLYVAYSDWMMRVQFPANVAPAINSVRATPWGQSKRGARVGAFSETYTMGQGQLDQTQVLQRGGVIQSAIAFPVHVAEIVRCTTLAIRRRRDLMGPTCKYDPLTQNLVDVLARKPGPPNHWSEAWINVQLGCAYSAAGNLPQAKTALERSLLVAGQFDHPLTSTALVELGRIALESGDYPAAGRYCEEATYASMNFPNASNFGNLEEAFRLGFLAHLLLNQKGPYPPLAPALAWAKNQGSRQLQASLMLMAAEHLSFVGEPAQAGNLLSNARSAMARTDLPNSRLGAQFNYLNALVAYQTGNVAAGDQTLVAALGFQRQASLWNFQIALADTRYTRGNVSDRIAQLLYETVLRDPAPGDWATDPLESLSMLVADQQVPLEHWFELLLKNEKDRETALEVADRSRRHRFFRTLPMGGRLLALRWILEGPAEILSEQANLQRQNLLVHFPQYAKLSAQAAEIRARLAAMPLVSDAAGARQAQGALLTELGKVSQSQETLLRQIALRREPADMVFPPLRKTRDVQDSLAEGQVLLAFFATSRNLHAFLFSHDRYANWQVRSPGTVQKQISTMLRELGNFDGNHALTSAELDKDGWKAAGAKVLSLLLDKSNVDLAGNFDEIIIVPDGALWYLPFEALTIGPPDHQRLLISQAKVRYSPTVGLAVPYRGPHKPRPNIGVTVGKLHPQDDETVAADAFQWLAPAVAGSVALPRTLTAPSNLYRVLLDGLIAFEDLPLASGPYAWAPLQSDRGKSGETLNDWWALPWGGPEQLILPGYHTAAESGLKKGPADGNEVFLSICGLMASGARTILISRWRTAGQTSYDLVREFAQELPHGSAAEAWQRGVQVVSDAPLEADREPRVKEAGDGRPTANHPFFWAGYLLVDAGTLPIDVQQPGAAPGKPAAQPAGPRPVAPQTNGARPFGAPLAGPPAAGPTPTTTPANALSPPAGSADGSSAADDADTDADSDAAKRPIRNRTKTAPPKKSRPRKDTGATSAAD